MDNIKFSLTYDVLKELGKQQYSNPISAISELIANSIDASANNIYVVIDKRNKKNSSLVIHDDGIGMSEVFVEENYSKIGFKKRNNINYKDKNVMGRKGIGKLAALYLSNYYKFKTKTETDKEWKSWEVDFRDFKNRGDENPEIKKIDLNIFEKNMINDPGFKFEKSGMHLIIENINLTYIGEKKIEYLEEKIANLFTVKGLNQTSIFIKILNSDDDIKNGFKKITKKTSFSNMPKILYLNLNDDKNLKDEILECENTILNVAPKIQNYSKDDIIKIKTKVVDFSTNNKIIELSNSEIDDVQLSDEGDSVKISNHSLSGWVGINLSILEEESLERVAKSKSNNKIRLYVNEKLAHEDLLIPLNNSQVFSKYIEGEVKFDILDDKKYVDIATSSRQDFNQEDNRFKKLMEYIAVFVNDLIDERIKIGKLISNEEEKIKFKRSTHQKKELITDIKKIDPKISDESISYLNTHLKGDYFKDKTFIFLSHSSGDEVEINMWQNILIQFGIKKDEIFNTSDKTRELLYNDDGLSIFDVMSNKLKSSDTFVFYYITDNFKDSQNAVMEAGIGWATKMENNSYKLISDNTDDTLKNFAAIVKGGHKVVEFSEPIKKSALGINTYNTKIIKLANSAIKHINIYRKGIGEKEIGLISEAASEEDENYKSISNIWNKSLNIINN